MIVPHLLEEDKSGTHIKKSMDEGRPLWVSASLKSNITCMWIFLIENISKMSVSLKSNIPGQVYPWSISSGIYHKNSFLERNFIFSKNIAKLKTDSKTLYFQFCIVVI